MHRSLAFVVAGLILAGAAGCHRGQFRMPLTPGADRHVWRDPIDLESFRAPARDLLDTAEPPVGYAEARNNPDQLLSITLRLNWNAAVRSLPEAFELLCELHNSGELALSEFTAREGELNAALHDLADLKAQLDGLLAGYEARLPFADAKAPEAREAKQTVGAQASHLIERAAACLAGVRSPEDAPEPGDVPPAAPVPS